MKERRMKRLLAVCIVACPFLFFTGLISGYRFTIGEPYQQSSIETGMQIFSVREGKYKQATVYYFYLKNSKGDIAPYIVYKAAVEGEPKSEKWIIPVFEKTIPKIATRFTISDSSPDLPSTEN